MLLKLASLTQVPRTYSVVQPAGPQLGAVRSNINATGTVCVTLKLSAQTMTTEFVHRTAENKELIRNMQTAINESDSVM